MAGRMLCLGSCFILWASCGLGLDVSPDPLASRAEPIVGGKLAQGDPSVVMLVAGGGGQIAPYCTGTVIGKRTVLTAAHCIEVYGKSVSYYVVSGTDFNHLDPPVEVKSQRAHPQYAKTQGQEGDFGLLELAEDTPLQPLRINVRPLTSQSVGTSIRHVGFGNTDAQGNGFGTKREVTFPIRQVYPTLMESGAPGKNTCQGDSGGPGFIVAPNDTGESVAGVVSFGDKDCLQFGFDGRVDWAANWIVQNATWDTIATNAPGCGSDAYCNAACNPVDPDCACAKDGQCRAECAAPGIDPDCASDCKADGVCSAGPCSRPDPDCQADGASCSNAQQCGGRKCEANLCTRSCGRDDDCQNGMICKSQLCAPPRATLGEACDSRIRCSRGVCADFGGERGLCLESCLGEDGCADGVSRCVTTPRAQQVCLTAANFSRLDKSSTLTVPVAFAEGPAAGSGCSAFPAGGFASLALLGLGLRRRRQNW